jgi:hypothetical protein
LLYLSTNSRPDIAASVSILSQRVQNPRDVDLNEVKRVIRYLKGTQELKLHLSSSNMSSELHAFSDSDWAESREDRKSHSGLYCFVNGGAIMWSCRKQSVTALSSAEAEYVALSETSKEVLWLRRIAEHFEIKSTGPTRVLTDSQSAMAMVENDRFSHRTKHIDTKFHFVKSLVEEKVIKLEYEPTASNVADLLTKPLGGNKIAQLRELAGLHSEER